MRVLRSLIYRQLFWATGMLGSYTYTRCDPRDAHYGGSVQPEHLPRTAFICFRSNVDILLSLYYSLLKIVNNISFMLIFIFIRVLC